MKLPSSDIAYLNELAVDYEIVPEARMVCIVIPQWPLPAGFDHDEIDLLVRLSAGYPDIAPDMWWFSPAVQKVGGEKLRATDVTETHLGRGWQRWSRHLAPGQWKTGVDGLESYLALIRQELEREAPVVAR